MEKRKSGLSLTIEQYSEEELIRQENDFLRRYNKDRQEGRKPLLMLWRMCQGYYAKLIVSVFFCILQLSASLFIPIATANVIDALSARQENALHVILLNLGIAVGLLAINYPMQKIYRSLRDDAIRSIEATLRGSIISKLQQMTIQFGKDMESGRIQSKLIRDVESIRGLLTTIHTEGTHIMVNLLVVIGVLISKRHWPMMLFFAVCGPAAVLIARRARGELWSKNSEYRRTVEETNARIADMVDLIPVTKAHGLGDVEVHKMTRQVQDSAKVGYQLDRITSKFVVSNWLVMQAFQVLCLALTVTLAYFKWMTVGDVTLYGSYFGTFCAYISTLIGFIPAISAGAEAVTSVGEILGSDDIEDNTGKQKLDTLRGEYDFRDVHFAYRDDPSTPVLQGLNIHVHAGETIALVGDSGSGKSTVINLVTGFDFCNSGQVTVDGVDIRELDLTSYREKIAVVLQNSILFSGTVRENITYGLPAVSEGRLQEVIDLACLRDVVDHLPEGVDTRVGEHGSRLSGGQRQRISIARALIRDPQVIIFDEATSALDTVSEKHIQTAVDNLSRDKTTFIVAHRLSTVKNADKIAVIRDGRCVEFGGYEELIEKKGAFYRFRELQV